jgi:orotidine-5'-phosphate decarboxylase
MFEQDDRNRLIVALDVSTADEARRLVRALGDTVCTYKIGKQLFTAAGPQLVAEFVAAGQRIFLDLKFHDIPNTVRAAVHSAATLGVSMLTVHASGGPKMLRAAVEAAGQVPKPPMVLAVTVLTSLTEEDLKLIGINAKVQDQVLRLAALALDAGCGGIVASALEVHELRRALGSQFAIITPGVRPSGAPAGDQARVVTPGEAIAAGATHIVVGRPITEAQNPAAAARAVLREISGNR